MISTNFSPYVEISLDNLIYNVNQIRSAVSPGIEILAVVKDSSYGCGSIQIAKTLEQFGDVHSFAVARPQEAFALRENGISGMILVLGRSTAEEIDEGSLKNIVFTLNDLSDFDIWMHCRNEIRFHCNIDTAMHRLGLLPSEIPYLISKIKGSKKIHLEGIFTHLANADQPGTTTVDTQRTTFFKCIDLLKSNDISPLHIHYGNSAGLMCFPMTNCTMIRPGIALYGCKPDPSGNFCLDLRPVLSLKSTVVKVKKVPAGTPVSYGGHYITSEETQIATVAIGYAHGLPRFLNNRGNILVGGIRYKIAGNITMDYVMIDIGKVSKVKAGDEAVAIGIQENERITPDEIALAGNTISYEILCNIGKGIDRFYLFNNSIVMHYKWQIF